MIKFLLSVLLWIILGSFLAVLLAVFVGGWMAIAVDDDELKEEGVDVSDQ